jgi:Zn-dependent protease
MLREPAASPDYLPPSLSFSDDSPQSDSEESLWLRGLVLEYLTIASEETTEPESLSAEDRGLLAQHDSRMLVTFSGKLRQDAETTYARLDAALLSRDMLPLLRENPANSKAPELIHIVKGRPAKPLAWSIWPNIALFLLTILTVLYSGTATAIGELSSTDPAKSTELLDNFLSFAILPELWRGWPYALSILLILVAHEMGHYLMMRYHKAHATLPYFIPSWLPIGTLGAAIVLREPLKNRKMLLDVGASGPIAGFMVALPILFIGLATSQLVPLESGWVEGNSLFYFFAKFLVFKEAIPSATQDVLVNQVAWAGWTGLFFTALNLLPLGQLDGGHVMYALLGARARLAYIPVLVGLVFLMIVSGQTTWILFFGLLFFFGRVYAVPLNDISPLDGQRRFVGVIALLIFVLCFTPFPLYLREMGEIPGSSSAMQWGMIGTVLVLSLPRLFRRKR